MSALTPSVAGCGGSIEPEPVGYQSNAPNPYAATAAPAGSRTYKSGRRMCHGIETRLSIPGPDINDYSLAGLNHGLGTTDINSGAGNPASPGSLEDPLPIIRQAHMSSRSSLLGSPVRLSPSHVSLSCRGGNDGEALSKVGCVAEATGGDAAMFSVVQLHVLPHGFE